MTQRQPVNQCRNEANLLGAGSLKAERNFNILSVFSSRGYLIRNRPLFVPKEAELLSGKEFDRHGGELASPGLFVDMRPGQSYLLAVR